MKKTLKPTKQGKTTPPAPNPAPANKETLAQLQTTMTAVAERVEDRRRAFFDNPDDVETIHRFRTNSRTLRSLVAFVKPWQDAEQNAQTQTILRDIVRHTSRLRELDVLEQQVRIDPAASPKLVRFCHGEAAAERAKVLEVLMSKKVSRLFDRAMLMAKSVAWKRRYAKRGLSQDEVQERFDAMVESVRADLASLDPHDAERTHDVRKRAKRARYVAEHNTGILGPNAPALAKGMMAHQDSLGDMCDARANIRLIDEFLRRDLPKSVARDLMRMQAQNRDVLKELLSKA